MSGATAEALSRRPVELDELAADPPATPLEPRGLLDTPHRRDPPAPGGGLATRPQVRR